MSDPKEQSVTDTPTPVDEGTETQDLGGEATTPEGMVAKAEFEKVKGESIKRKRRIQELQAQLDSSKTTTAESQDLQGQIDQLRKATEAKDREISRLRHLGTIRERLVGMNVLDPAVAELAYQAAETDESLDPELLDGFLADWKQKHASLFKAESRSPVTSALPQATQKVTSPPATMTPEGEYKAFVEMSADERAALPRDQFDKMMKLAYKISGDLFKQGR